MAAAFLLDGVDASGGHEGEGGGGHGEKEVRGVGVICALKQAADMLELGSITSDEYQTLKAHLFESITAAPGRHVSPHCIRLQHNATHSNTPQYTTRHCRTCHELRRSSCVVLISYSCFDLLHLVSCDVSMCCS